jgi:hypothetical protein
MKKIIISALSLVALFFFTSCGGATQEELPEAQQDNREQLGIITKTYGNPTLVREVNGESKKWKAKIGTRLTAADRLVTRAGEWVDVKLDGRGVVKVKQNSDWSILEGNSGGSYKTKLEKGKVLVALSKLGKNDTFSIETPTGVAGVRGTSFSIESEGKGARLAVLTGKVEIETTSGEKLIVDQKTETGFSDAGVDAVSKIRGATLADVKGLLDIDGIKDTGEYDLIQKNIKSLEIEDQKAMELEDANRQLSTKGLDKATKNVKVESKEEIKDANVEESTGDFQSDDDMMVK